MRLPLPPEDNGEYHDVFQNYEIEVENRDELVKYLNKNKIQATLPWGGKGVHQFKALGLGHFKLPRTEEFFRKGVMLPLYPELENSQIRYLTTTIKDFYDEKT